MNPLTYLGFTIFSIIMQFCVMEFIHEKIQLDKGSVNPNESINMSKALIKAINRKPHALFYRSETAKNNFETYNDPELKKYSNSSLEDIILTTTDSSSAYEVYYENSSIMEDFFTTESYTTNSEFDNITEIAFLDKTNITTPKPSVGKNITNNKCYCNLLYQKCDINCCCDLDCTAEERGLFINNCAGDGCRNINNGIDFCNPPCRNATSFDLTNNLFCVHKVNLPDKRIKSKFQLDEAGLNATFKWNTIKRSDMVMEYKKKKYQYGDPLWLLKNGTISSISIPTTMINLYCNGNKQIFFLVNENVKCNVKMKDLYMFSALKTVEESKLISVIDLSINATVLNCSTLYCTNWTVLACYENNCSDYNKTIHTPVCTHEYCNNVAYKMEYTFYYFESKVTNASLKMYMTTIPISIPLLIQTITVQWYLGNESIENTIQLSGNPGYISGLPLIISFATNNHTKNFYNQSHEKSVLPFPRNIHGQCSWLSVENKTLLFGLNTRLKCRLNVVQDISLKNSSGACLAIQTNIKKLLRLSQEVFVSPYGNPQDLSDDKWVPLEVYDHTFLYGEYNSKNSKLVCYNLATRYEFVIAYLDSSEAIDKRENKVVKATVGATYSNVTFDVAELTTVLTIDVRFIDVSKPVIEFARAPNLNIQLPANFFLDFPSNHRCHHIGDTVLVLQCCILLLMIK